MTEEERVEAYGTGAQAATEPDHPFEYAKDFEAALGIDDTVGEEHKAYGTSQLGDTTREDRSA